MHAWEAPTDEVTQAVTRVSVDDDDRPDAPELEGARCEIGGCGEPAKVTCWSAKYTTWFCYCEPHADQKTDGFADLEVAD